jgi:hypothetical protein
LKSKLTSSYYLDQIKSGLLGKREKHRGGVKLSLLHPLKVDRLAWSVLLPGHLFRVRLLSLLGD